MRREKTESTGEQSANAATHIVGSHLGAAMLALVVWQGTMSREWNFCNQSD